MNERPRLAETLRFINAGWPAAILFSLAAAAALAVFHWEQASHPMLLGWLALLGSVYAGATLSLWAQRRASSRIQSSETNPLLKVRLTSLAGGVAWGLGGLLLEQAGNPLQDACLALVMSGLGVGSLIVLGIDRASALSFVAPMLAPLSFRLLFEPGAPALLGLASILVLVCLIAAIVRREAYPQDERSLRRRTAVRPERIRGDEIAWKGGLDGNGLGFWSREILSGRVVYSPYWQHELGYGEERIGADEWAGRLHPEDRESVSAALRRHIAGETPRYETEHRVRRSDGRYLWVLDRGRVSERAEDGSPRRMVGVQIDISGRKSAEIELRIAATVFDAQEGVMVTDADEVILRVNRAFTKMTGYSEEEVVGRTPRLLKSGRHGHGFYRAMWSSIERTGCWQGEIWNRRKTGEIYPEWLSTTALKNAAGQVTHYVATLHDITERKAAEEAIQHLAFYDALTALPNRRLLLDRLNHARILSGRSGRAGALLFIDLDRFKELNDRLGHTIGDLMLQEVARRLRESIRDVDTVARLGGDEFVVMLEDLSSDLLLAENRAAEVAAKILGALAVTYQLAGHIHESTPSIGIVLFTGTLVGAGELLTRADLAMYRAKASGRNAIRFFDADMQESARARAALKDELKSAIGEGEFALRYQPQVDAAGSMVGAEVLLRWANPRRVSVGPSEFIPLAEESGLILPLGHWVLKSACEQLRAWSGTSGWDGLKLSVNISARQFRDPGFVEQILALLDKTGADPKRLTFELRESLLLRDREAMIARMESLKTRGVRFTLDNFGTGFLAPGELKDLPFDQLKLDRSFVRDLLTEPRATAIAKSVIGLGQALGFDVVATGVETEAQRQILQTQSCYAFQGYLFSRPLSLEELDQAVRNRTELTDRPHRG